MVRCNKILHHINRYVKNRTKRLRTSKSETIARCVDTIDSDTTSIDLAYKGLSQFFDMNANQESPKLNYTTFFDIIHCWIFHIPSNLSHFENAPLHSDMRDLTENFEKIQYGRFFLNFIRWICIQNVVGRYFEQRRVFVSVYWNAID